ncbi:LOW QUALITY PROTEIN: hypothetical protein IFM46972_03683 [Aspergillus udagawae]|uniref:Uncharacterized protein n=1 Tax=Aspergillus udagawae TaxID=91492 RepID=A0A8H3RUH3_9EURO|nr:LOW QUALITY PROTEIN: hypothetical protein IFM46972_03683 [Aspergillus udagawae]
MASNQKRNEQNMEIACSPLEMQRLRVRVRERFISRSMRGQHSEKAYKGKTPPLIEQDEVQAIVLDLVRRMKLRWSSVSCRVLMISIGFVSLRQYGRRTRVISNGADDHAGLPGGVEAMGCGPILPWNKDR